MKLLLDSQVLLWSIYAPHLLTERLRLLLRDPATELIVSHAGLWELLGKIGRGKLLLAGTSIDLAMQRIAALGVTFLPVPKSEAISNIESLLDRAEGAEVVIEDGPRTVKLISPESSGPGRLLSESIASARLRASSAAIDEDFAADVQAAITR